MKTDLIYKLPRWMKVPLPDNQKYTEVKKLTETHHLNTICSSGKCPNRGECWSAGTASFMIMGEKCTRNCRFCSVPNMMPDPLDWNEPMRLAQTIQKLQLKHCVITSVNRDDLEDGGASFWVKTIETIKLHNPEITIEVLIPDFHGKEEDIQKIIDAKPNVISHNLETVQRLSPQIRDMARYRRSLKVIRQISDSGIVSKSGIMVGLGETSEEVLNTMDDLRDSKCKVLTIGQYLQPEANLAPVVEFIHPDVFKYYETQAYKKGFKMVESSPLVRSSYHAERHVHA